MLDNAVYDFTMKTKLTLETGKKTKIQSLFKNLFFKKSVGFMGSVHKERSDESNETINIARMNKNHLKCACLCRSNRKGIKEPILFSFSSDEPPGYRVIKVPRSKLYKENKKASFYITSRMINDV